MEMEDFQRINPEVFGYRKNQENLPIAFKQIVSMLLRFKWKLKKNENDAN